MKVLLDHCVPHRLRYDFIGHEVFTAAYMRWGGLRNGTLMKAAADDGFDCLLTVDQSIPYQHNLSQLPLAVVVIESKSNEYRDLRPSIPKVLEALVGLQPRSVAVVR